MTASRLRTPIPTGSFKTGPTSYLLLAPERMVYWHMASAPVIWRRREIAGEAVIVVVRPGSPWIAPREPCHLLGIRGLDCQVPWRRTPGKLAANHQMDVALALDDVLA